MMEKMEKLSKVGKQKTPNAVSSSHLLIGITVLLVIVVSISSVFSMILWREIKELKEAHNTSLASLQQSISQLENNQQVENQKQANLLHVVQDTKMPGQQEVLSEVGYLIRMASMHLNYGNDVSGGKLLLEQANKRAEKLTDARFNSLKNAIKNDLTALSKASTVDQAGILNKLNQVSLAVTKLALTPRVMKTQDLKIRETSLPQAQTWWERLKTNLAGLKGLVVLRHVPTEADILIGPTQVFAIKQSIQVKLAQAQWAVLRYRNDIYQQSVASALQLTKELENLHLSGVESIVTQLNALQAVNLSTTRVPLQSATVINNDK